MTPFTQEGAEKYSHLDQGAPADQESGAKWDKFCSAARKPEADDSPLPLTYLVSELEFPGSILPNPKGRLYLSSYKRPPLNAPDGSLGSPPPCRPPGGTALREDTDLCGPRPHPRPGAQHTPRHGSECSTPSRCSATLLRSSRIFFAFRFLVLRRKPGL